MPVLSRLQRNEIHEICGRRGLDAGDCQWTSKDQHGDLTETLIHRPTDAHISFSLTSESFWVAWWPNFRDGHEPHGAFTWQHAARAADLWATLVKQNHQVPDLWAEAAKAKGIPNAAGDVAADNSPFDAGEIKLLKPRLDEIEGYIAARQPLSEPQRRELRQRFDYLLAAAKRGVGRIDWLNIFMGQVVQLITNQLLDASLYSDLMKHASQLLSSIINFGSRMLGSGS